MLVIDGKYNNEDGLSTTTMISDACITGSICLSLMASTIVNMA
jgi:hypothetical protein